MDNLTIFDLMYEDYKITKPIRLIEFFAGYGSQAFALKYLGVPFEHWRICEWAVPSIQAYKDAHFTNDNIDYSKCFTKEYIIEFLYHSGISMDYNQPMKLEQIKRMSEEQLRTIYNNILATNNLVNIQKVKGEQLNIVEQDKYTYVLTYSFPCQDLSLAGKGAGMSRDGGTRSGMLWEVERILDECNLLNCLPQVLLMENVPQVIGNNNIKDFQSWRSKLESLGYSNYIEVLNAKHYGIPQNRERAFMISILGEYNYTFPKRIPLDKKLKDMLEKNVDEKYYLSDKQINQVIHWNAQQEPLETLGKELLKIKEATKKGYKEAYEGDGIDISGRMETHRGTVQKGMSQTLKTSIDVGVVVKDEYVGTYNFSASDNFMQGKDRFYENREISPTLLTQPKEGIVFKKDTPNYIQWEQKGRLDMDCRAWKENCIAPTTTPNTKVLLENPLRIRKLTPKECFRLMGVKDEDYENIAKNQSNSKLYHLAGDSIVVNVLMGIFKEMIQ